MTPEERRQLDLTRIGDKLVQDERDRIAKYHRDKAQDILDYINANSSNDRNPNSDWAAGERAKAAIHLKSAEIIESGSYDD